MKFFDIMLTATIIFVATSMIAGTIIWLIGIINMII
jgi:hypothetical protein